MIPGPSKFKTTLVTFHCLIITVIVNRRPDGERA
jgi:hypothetical protein